MCLLTNLCFQALGHTTPFLPSLHLILSPEQEPFPSLNRATTSCSSVLPQTQPFPMLSLITNFCTCVHLTLSLKNLCIQCLPWDLGIKCLPNQSPHILWYMVLLLAYSLLFCGNPAASKTLGQDLYPNGLTQSPV